MINKKDSQQKTIDEIHEIMFIFRGSNATQDGDFRSQHLGTVLEYLKGQQTEDKTTTMQKLTILLGMSQRQVRENYIDGLIAWGVISISSDCKRWTWIGITAIKNKFGQLRKNTPEDNEFVVDAIKKGESETPFMDSIGDKKK